MFPDRYWEDHWFGILGDREERAVVRAVLAILGALLTLCPALAERVSLRPHRARIRRQAKGASWERPILIA